METVDLFLYLAVDSELPSDEVEEPVAFSECDHSSPENCAKKPLIYADQVLLSHHTFCSG